MTGHDLRHRRLVRGLSRREVADRTGVTSAAIEHAEQSSHELRGPLTDKLARALVRHGETQPRAGTPSDAARAHALLADLARPCTLEQIAEVLRWSLARATAALEALEERLADSGQAIEPTGRHTYRLAPRDHLLSDTERRRAHQAPAGPLTQDAAAILHQIIEGPRRRRYRDNFTTPGSRPAIERLLAADLVWEDDATALWPTDRALLTLGLITTAQRQTTFHFQRTTLTDIS